MAISVGVHASAANTSGTTVATSGIATTTGSTIVVGLIWDSAQTFTSLTENGGNGTPTQIGSEFSTGFAAKIRLYYWKNITGNASHTFTLTTSGGVKDILVAELKSADTTAPLDKSPAANAAANPQPYLVTATGVLSQADECYVCFIGTDSGSNPATFAESTGLTITEKQDNGVSVWTAALGTKVVSATTSLQASWTDTGATNSMLASATFKGAAAATFIQSLALTGAGS